MAAGASAAQVVEARFPAENRRDSLVLTPTPASAPSPLSPDEARRFREVVLPHADAAYNLALRLARRGDVAEDIVHDAYVRALAAFRGYRGGDGRSWILTIVRNRFYDWAREQRLKATAPLARPANDPDDDDTDWDPPDLEQDSPEQALARKGEAGALHALIDGLPARWREVLILREMDELSYREIAAVTESPIGSVMSRLARARSALAAAWRKREADMAEASS
ncbi:MAG TPA: sigma-70 family RNA polymerase sigma factor [Caulobacteraceae bacterium]|nr:sigma-70 family RNA polymerase sigma factor [Caulobacteraceae bacterium]